MSTRWDLAEGVYGGRGSVPTTLSPWPPGVAASVFCSLAGKYRIPGASGTPCGL